MLQVAADRVPEPIRERPRKSLTAPFGGWMTVPEFAEPVLDQVRRSTFWDADILRRDWLDEVLGTRRAPALPSGCSNCGRWSR